MKFTDYLIENIPRKDLIYIKLGVDFCSMLIMKQYELQMTSAEFAAKIGVSERKLRKLMCGDINPTLLSISNICDRLDVTPHLTFKPKS